MELAALRRINRTGNIALQNDQFAVIIHISGRNRAQQSLSIGVQRMVKQLLGFCLLYHVAQIHNTDTIGNITDNGKIVSNKQVGQVLLFLQVAQQVDNLRLNGYIQCGNCLIANDKLGISSQTACNADSLALTAGKLVRIAVEEVGSQTAFFHDPHDRVLQSGAVFGIKAVRN